MWQRKQIPRQGLNNAEPLSLGSGNDDAVHRNSLGRDLIVSGGRLNSVLIKPIWDSQ